MFRPLKKEPTLVKSALTVSHEHISPFAEKLFQVLHLMHEDLKLDSLRYIVEGRKLRRLLLAWLLEEPYGPSKAAYVTYYLTEADSDDPEVRSMFKTELKRHAEQVRTADVEFEQVPNLQRWIDSMMLGKHDIADYPLCFELSRVVCRLYQVFLMKEATNVLCISETTERLEDLMTDGVMDSALRTILVCKKSALYTALKHANASSISNHDYLMMNRNSQFSDLHVFEKVLYTMKQERVGLAELQTWPMLVSLPFLEVIRYTRRH